MIGVLTLFGETDLQPILKKTFAQENMFFVQDNCNTSVQLMTQLEEHGKETDVVIIYANAINMDTFPELCDMIRKTDKLMRIILILNGRPEQYLRSVLNEYAEKQLDLIFDDNGFDAEELLNFVRKGKLSHRSMKTQRKESGFQGDIVEEKKREATPYKKPNSFLRDVAKRKSVPEKSEDSTEAKSFAEPHGHYTIGIMNATRGAGATTTAYNLARYVAMHKYKTCVADLSGSGAVKLMKANNVDVFAENIDVPGLKNQYNIVICDFGTPIEISADGQNFKLTSNYTPQNIQLFLESDIKLIMGFGESWNIEKIKFFFHNDTWREKFDESYLFILPQHAEKLKNFYPDYNILNRDEDFREMILEVLRKDEA